MQPSNLTRNTTTKMPHSRHNLTLLAGQFGWGGALPKCTTAEDVEHFRDWSRRNGATSADTLMGECGKITEAEYGT